MTLTIKLTIAKFDIHSHTKRTRYGGVRAFFSILCTFAKWQEKNEVLCLKWRERENRIRKNTEEIKE